MSVISFYKKVSKVSKVRPDALRMMIIACSSKLFILRKYLEILLRCDRLLAFE